MLIPWDLAHSNLDIHEQILPTSSSSADLFTRVLACSDCGRIVSHLVDDADGEHVGLFSGALSSAL